MIRDNEFRFAFVEKTPVFQGIDGQRRIGNSFGIPIAFTTFNSQENNSLSFLKPEVGLTSQLAQNSLSPEIRPVAFRKQRALFFGQTRGSLPLPYNTSAIDRFFTTIRSNVAQPPPTIART
jgi:hypothetical protein